MTAAETRLDVVLRSFVERRSKTYDNSGPMASGYVLCSECGATYDRAVVHKPGCIVPRLLALADHIGP